MSIRSLGQFQHLVRRGLVAERLLGDLPVRVAGDDRVHLGRGGLADVAWRRWRRRDGDDLDDVAGADHRRVGITKSWPVELHQGLGELPHVVLGRTLGQEALGDPPDTSPPRRLRTRRRPSGSPARPRRGDGRRRRTDGRDGWESRRPNTGTAPAGQPEVPAGAELPGCRPRFASPDRRPGPCSAPRSPANGRRRRGCDGRRSRSTRRAAPGRTRAAPATRRPPAAQG